MLSPAVVAGLLPVLSAFTPKKWLMEWLGTAPEKIAKKPSESTSLNKLKAVLEQGLELLASRQKLIKHGRSHQLEVVRLI